MNMKTNAFLWKSVKVLPLLLVCMFLAQPARSQNNVQKLNEIFTQLNNSLSQINSTLQQKGNSGANNTYNYNTGTYNNYNTSNYNNNNSESNNNYNNSSTGNVYVEKHCKHCAGSGDCSKCGGDGYVLGKFSQEFEPCSSCNFKGRTPKSKQGKCTYCNGTGKR